MALSAAISVIVPVRDARATLPETLDSLRGQTFSEWQAVVLDDASSDGSRELAERLAAAAWHPRGPSHRVRLPRARLPGAHVRAPGGRRVRRVAQRVRGLGPMAAPRPFGGPLRARGRRSGLLPGASGCRLQRPGEDAERRT